MGRRHEQTFFHRHTDGQKVHEKVLIITNYQGNINQNHNEVSPHTLEWLLSKRQITSVGITERTPPIQYANAYIWNL